MILYQCIKFGLPLLIGGLAGASARRVRSGVWGHAVSFLTAFLATVAVEYVYFSLLGLTTDGEKITLAGIIELASGFLSQTTLFVLFIVSITTAVQFALGYLVGALLTRPGVEPGAPAGPPDRG